MSGPKRALPSSVTSRSDSFLSMDVSGPLPHSNAHPWTNLVAKAALRVGCALHPCLTFEMQPIGGCTSTTTAHVAP
eukprot:6807561-Karenia_brevis.AAC.1